MIKDVVDYRNESWPSYENSSNTRMYFIKI